jgi:hypothetical protein
MSIGAMEKIATAVTSWEQGLQRSIDQAIGLAMEAGDWSDDICYLDARIAANYAFQLQPDLRESKTWIHPEALQFRGTKGGRWVPGIGSVS